MRVFYRALRALMSVAALACALMAVLTLGGCSEQADNWKLILVNRANPLPEGFTVTLKSVNSAHSVDARIYDDLQAMLKAAHAEGLYVYVTSSYRTRQKQTTLYTNKVNLYVNQGYSRAHAEVEAAKWVAIPDTSEHQTGLALDLVSSGYRKLDKKQEETAEQKWLMQNSYKYGFILRYPEEFTEITGIYYEPWHYRYVGKEAAKEIFTQGVCLETYLEQMQARVTQP